jgi:hypothetical protein
MTYREVKKEYYGIEVEATVFGVASGIVKLHCFVQPYLLSNIEIHICGKKAYLTF